MKIENIYTSDYVPPPHAVTNEDLERQTLAIITGQLVAAELGRTGVLPNLVDMAKTAHAIQCESDALWGHVNGYD